MTELEQLRKEVKELRERVAMLEASNAQWKTVVPLPRVLPDPYVPPFTITCGGNT